MLYSGGGSKNCVTWRDWVLGLCEDRFATWTGGGIRSDFVHGVGGRTNCVTRCWWEDKMCYPVVSVYCDLLGL